MFRKKRVFCAALVCICCLGSIWGCSRNSGKAGEAAEEAAPAEGPPSAPLAEESAAEAPEESGQNGGGQESETGRENGAGPETGAGPEAEGGPELAQGEGRNDGGDAPPPPRSGGPETQAAALNDIPEALRMPRWGESPRFPQDRLIGALGRGDADAVAYRYVLNLMESLLVPENRERALSGLRSAAAEDLIRVLDEVQPVNFRMGSGQDEGDNSFSFLIRFMGSGKSSAGEVYVYLANGRWTLEDMILEEEPEGEVSRFDYPSYQQFF